MHTCDKFQRGIREVFLSFPGGFYAPNFEEVEGAYWFGPVRPSVRLSVSPSVRLSVCLSVTLFGSSETQEPLMLES